MTLTLRASGQVELTSLQPGGESPPLGKAEGQHWPLRVLRVTHRDSTGQVLCDCHALPAVAAAVGRLAPLGARHVHCPTTSVISCSDARGGSASALRWF